MRAALLVVLVIGCNSNDPAPTVRAQPMFQCRKTGLTGAPWRECAPPPHMTRCEEYGCFQRPTAHCFPVLFAAFGDLPEQQWTICTPSPRECEEWNEDRKHVENRSLGPCVEMRPDEYRALEPAKPPR